MTIINFIKKISTCILIIFISFILFLGIEWITDGLQWYEYQSDYYITGTVIDKTTIGHQYGSEIYVTVEFDGKASDNGYYTAANKYLGAGTSVGFTTKYAECESTVYSIGNVK